MAGQSAPSEVESYLLMGPAHLNVVSLVSLKTSPQEGSDASISDMVEIPKDPGTTTQQRSQPDTQLFTGWREHHELLHTSNVSINWRIQLINSIKAAGLHMTSFRLHPPTLSDIRLTHKGEPENRAVAIHELKLNQWWEHATTLYFLIYESLNLATYPSFDSTTFTSKRFQMWMDGPKLFKWVHVNYSPTSLHTLENCSPLRGGSTTSAASTVG